MNNTTRIMTMALLSTCLSAPAMAQMAPGGPGGGNPPSDPGNTVCPPFYFYSPIFHICVPDKSKGCPNGSLNPDCSSPPSSPPPPPPLPNGGGGGGGGGQPGDTCDSMTLFVSDSSDPNESNPLTPQSIDKFLAQAYFTAYNNGGKGQEPWELQVEAQMNGDSMTILGVADGSSGLPNKTTMDGVLRSLVSRGNLVVWERGIDTDDLPSYIQRAIAVCLPEPPSFDSWQGIYPTTKINK